MAGRHGVFKMKFDDLFSLKGRVCVSTGGTGLLGQQHATIIAAAGGIPVMADVRQLPDEEVTGKFGADACSIRVDITSQDEGALLLSGVLQRFGRVDILV